VTGPRPPSQGDDTPLNPPDVDTDELGRELSGDQQDGDQVFYRRQGEVQESDREFNDVAQYEGEPEIDRVGNDAVRVEDLAELELREGETGNPDVAAEEGLTWVPPVDPPVVADPDDPQGARIAAGFGTSAEDSPYDSSNRAELLTAEDDMEARIREALLADSATTQYADSLVIATRDATVAVRGVVDDLDDTDIIVEVIGRVEGVDEVIEELEVRGVTD
jgi:hypothetical protein